ncbi:Ig-like domain-containing protein [Colwelliaceae bacterium 6471]
MLLSSTLRCSILLLPLLLAACGGGSGDTKTVTPPKTNTPPVASNDVISANVNETVTIDVLANDSDVGDSMTISEVTTPAFGQVSSNDNALSYQPNENFIGKDTFSYTVKDSSGATDTALVEVTVKNVAPKAENDLVQTQQSIVVTVDALANDSSQGNHSLTIVSTSNPAHGVVNLDDGLITYTPNSGFAGQDSFAYIVRDSYGDESTAAVAITVVNTEPTAVDDVVSTSQNQALEISSLSNDIDAVGDELTISGLSAAENGSASLEDGIITYIPNNGYSGIDHFTYTIVDNYGATSQADISVDVANSDPVANDDAERVFKNSVVMIDVLANDEDVAGDVITLQSVSNPLHGSAVIVDGKIEYQPQTDFVGEDVFGYTLEDSYEASASGFIIVTVNNGINVKGKLIGFNQANINVTLSVAEVDFTGTTDKNGAFEVEIDGTNTAALVIAHAENVTEKYSMHAYLGDVASYLAEMDESFSVDKQNISHLTTAEYELINYIQAQEENTLPVALINELEAARYLVDADIVLDLAVSTDIINANNGIELPDSYASINAFMQTPFAMQEQLSIWREEQPTEYYEVYDALFNNNDITSAPDELNQVNNILLNSSTTSGPYNTEHLILNEDNTGSIDNRGNGNTTGTFIWNSSDDELAITFDEVSNIISDDYYCGNNLSARDSFAANALAIKKLYSTTVYDVYIRRAMGTFNNSSCFDINTHQLEYDIKINAKTKPLVITAGVYHFGSIQTALPDHLGDADYELVSATFNLNDGGTFVETIDTVLTPRTGQWQLLNGSLQLDYDDGISIIYEKNAVYKGLDLARYYMIDAGVEVTSGETFIVPTQEVTWQNSTGYMLWGELPLYNNELDGGFGFKFDEGFTGVQQNNFIGEWSDSTSGLYTWSLTDNLYKFDYYATPDTFDFTAFCDINEANCAQWRRREVEIIGQVGSFFIAKIYQEINYPEEWGGGSSRSGYISLIDFSEL